MKWYSKRDDDHFALILFGCQRVMDSELSIAEPSSRLLSHKAIGQIIQKIAERLGLILTEE